MAAPGWESRAEAEPAARAILGELFEVAREAIEPVVMRLDSDAANQALERCRTQLGKVASAARKVHTEFQASPRHGLGDAGTAWDSWRSELVRALEALRPAVELADEWSRKAPPKRWRVGKPPSSASRRVGAAVALASLNVAWPGSVATAFAYLAIGSGLEPPCTSSREWDGRRDGWKKALQRAQTEAGKRQRAGRGKPTRQRTSR